ncbi:MAG: sigma-70 family RNA polymerase sigma factor, partial [Chitinophagaceae bacterium]|nr:sigma-70 family RNA polymerase sigma factor [Chitinophagaceae bacterium]
VYVMARNRVHSKLMGQAQAPEIVEQADELLNNPHASLELKELAGIMEDAIEALPPRRKEIFKLSRNENLTYEQIAARLNISRSTVREHMVEALVFLRHYLKKHGDIIISFFSVLCGFR